jgi:hypothetical protein
MASPGAAGQGAKPGSGPDAESLAVKFGGNRSGRPRADGLVPGSPEAIIADRAKDAARKAQRRAKERQVLALSNGGAVPQVEASEPNADGSPVAPVGPSPWDPGLLKPVFDQLVPSIEKFMVARIGAKAAKAGLPTEVVREIEKDAAFPIPAKAGISTTGPMCVAKWLNMSGIGAENAPEIILATAVASIVAGQFMLSAKLDSLLKANAPKSQPPTPKENDKNPSPASV